MRERSAYSSSQPASSIFQDVPWLSPSRLANFPVRFISHSRRKYDFLHVIYLRFVIIWYWLYATSTKILDPWYFALLGELVKSGDVRALSLEIPTGECLGETPRLPLGHLCPLRGARGSFLRECSPFNGHSYPFKATQTTNPSWFLFEIFSPIIRRTRTSGIFFIHCNKHIHAHVPSTKSCSSKNKTWSLVSQSTTKCIR